MAARFTILKGTGGKMGSLLGFSRWIHSVPQSPPLAGSIDLGVRSLQPVLPEFSSPSFSFGGSMELMAVPKRKVSPHKRGIRNGPKALKPIPVIVLCKSCGRVRLPHFFCCGGKPNQGNNGGQNEPGLLVGQSFHQSTTKCGEWEYPCLLPLSGVTSNLSSIKGAA
ncbi:Zinc-binding ribosomal protein [Sesbania bispinosa]|nr:Zinc-binding ribosomal protein [Sesbania bispinosa]